MMCLTNVIRPKDIRPYQIGFRCNTCGQFMYCTEMRNWIQPCSCVQRWIQVGRVIHDQITTTGTTTSIPEHHVEYEPVFKGWKIKIQEKTIK